MEISLFKKYLILFNTGVMLCLSQHVFSFPTRGYEITTTSKKADRPKNSDTSANVVNIDAKITKSDLSKRYKGLCITENCENQSFWDYPISPATTIKEIDANLIRTGSDGVFWSEPPYSSAKPRLINYGPNESESKEKDLVENDGIHLKSRYLNFDAFIALCQKTNSEADVIVPYNKIYYKGSVGSNKTSKEDFLRNAETLVNYANYVKGYHIKFWEIGNETWQKSNGITAEQYRDDIILFSKRMKAVDPSIKIIVNGNSGEWFKTVLAGAASSIDFINISFYPTYPWSGYDYYKVSDIDFAKNNFLQDALSAISNSRYKNKIKLIITEFNAVSFGKGTWKDRNDLGHALACSQMYDDLATNPDIFYVAFWNLRWYYKNAISGEWKPDDTEPRNAYNATDRNGHLNPNGLALSIWNRNLLNRMVQAGSDNQLIRTYATCDGSNSKMNVFIINKDSSNHKVRINLKNYPDDVGEVWTLRGNGDTDSHPIWAKTTNLRVKNNTITLDLNSISLTMIKLNSR